MHTSPLWCKECWTQAEDLKVVDEFSPKQIAPTLAMKAPPSTGELMKAPSRFLLKPKENMGK